MLDKDDIIEEIRIALDGVSKEAKGAKPGDDRFRWAKRVMIALCQWGLRKGLWVGAANMENRRNLKELAKKYGGSVEMGPDYAQSSGEWYFSTRHSRLRGNDGLSRGLSPGFHRPWLAT